MTSLVLCSRLAVLHCDDRPPDSFAEGEHRKAFLECLFAVTDLLEDTELDTDDVQSTVSWMLRQSAINRRPAVKTIRAAVLASPGQYATPRLDTAAPVIECCQISLPVSDSSAATRPVAARYITPLTTIGVTSELFPPME